MRHRFPRFIRFLPLLTSLAFLAVLTQGLGACSSKSSGTISQDPDPTLNPVIETGKRLLAQAQVVCPNPMDCPSTVGLFVGIQESEVIECTTFPITHDQVVTAAHCLPADLRVTGADCTGRIKVLFAPNLEPAESAESAGCAKVLSVTPPKKPGDYQALDMAVLKLDHALARNPLVLSTSGLPDATVLRLPSVHSISDALPIVELRTQTCKVTQGSRALPQFQTDRSPMGVVAGCNPGEAGAGSPLLDAEGRFRGFFQSTYDEDETPVKSTQKSFAVVNDLLSFVANAACLDFPGKGSGPSDPQCNADLSTSATEVLLKGFENTSSRAPGETALANAIKTWVSDHSSLFRWTSLRSDGAPSQDLAEDITATPVPECVIGTDDALKPFLKPFWQWGKYEDKGDVAIDLPQWELSFGLSSAQQEIYILKELPHLQVEGHIQPAHLFNLGSSTVLFEVTDPGSSRPRPTPLFNRSLMKCP
jgi:hypothetical protein